MTDSSIQGETPAPTRPGYRFVGDWGQLPGCHVQIFLKEALVAEGTVDAVTTDGKVLWLAPHGLSRRRLYEQDWSYRVWAPDSDATIRAP